MAFPFLCQYYFPLYNCNISLIYKATIEECIVISTGVCSQIWNVAVAFGYESLLPNCNNLPTGIQYKVKNIITIFLHQQHSCHTMAPIIQTILIFLMKLHCYQMSLVEKTSLILIHLVYVNQGVIGLNRVHTPVQW